MHLAERLRNRFKKQADQHVTTKPLTSNPMKKVGRFFNMSKILQSGMRLQFPHPPKMTTDEKNNRIFRIVYLDHKGWVVSNTGYGLVVLVSPNTKPEHTKFRILQIFRSCITVQGEAN